MEPAAIGRWENECLADETWNLATANYFQTLPTESMTALLAG